MRRRISFALVLSALLSFAPSLADAGDGGEPAPQWEIVARMRWAARVEAAKRAYDAFAREAQSASHRREEVRERVAHEAGLEGFLTDATLQSGDLVVTENGLRMFKGARRAFHAPANFVVVDGPEAASSAELAELQRAVALAPR